MNRRNFTQLTGASLAALAGNSAFADHHGKKGKAFKAKFAPSPGQLFAGKGKKLSYVDQMKLAYDLGFRAWEDNGLNRQKNETLEKIAEYMKDSEDGVWRQCDHKRQELVPCLTSRLMTRRNKIKIRTRSWGRGRQNYRPVQHDHDPGSAGQINDSRRADQGVG